VIDVNSLLVFEIYPYLVSLTLILHVI
jgi:hypothetical protein